MQLAFAHFRESATRTCDASTAHAVLVSDWYLWSRLREAMKSAYCIDSYTLFLDMVLGDRVFTSYSLVPMSSPPTH
jgi:hypothetical protein